MLAAWVCLFSCFLRHMRMYALQTGESFFWCLGLLILIDTAHIVCSRVCVQCLSVCPGYRRLHQRAADWLLCVRRDAAPKERRHCSTAVSSKGEQCHVAGWSQTCLLCFLHSVVIPLIDTAHVVSGAGSMKLSGVCLSIQPIIHTPFQQVGCWAPCQREIGLYTVSQKTRHLTLAHNFTKYSPIFKILS